MTEYVSPFTYFGNKQKVADIVWACFGEVPSYYEPFFGTGSVWFSYPHSYSKTFAVLNDLNGHVCNFWRSVKMQPQAVAEHMSMFRDEVEMHARLLLARKQYENLSLRLVEDIDFCDPVLAGYWASAISTDLLPQSLVAGPWKIGEDGKLVASKGTDGVLFLKPSMSRKNCVSWNHEGVTEQMIARLHAQLKHAYILCGDWERCFVEYKMEETPIAIFLDPPYDGKVNKQAVTYKDNKGADLDIVPFCLKYGMKPAFRIAVCGYSGEYPQLEDAGWTVYTWRGHGGFGRIARTEAATGQGKENAKKETIWFSPHCLSADSTKAKLSTFF